MPKITTSLPRIASTFDHALLHPTLTPQAATAAISHLITSLPPLASICLPPCLLSHAAALVVSSSTPSSSPVRLCAVVGFPHGTTTTSLKAAEALECIALGAVEIDMVVNVGLVLGEQWESVLVEISAVNQAVTGKGAILKVIFETDFLKAEHIVKLCEICTRAKVAFVKTSTGFGFVKGGDGKYSYRGATVPHLRLMREHSGPEVQVKASGGIKTLDEVLYVLSLGVTRIGTSSSEAIIDEARRRGIGDEDVEVDVAEIKDTEGGGY